MTPANTSLMASAPKLSVAMLPAPCGGGRAVGAQRTCERVIPTCFAAGTLTAHAHRRRIRCRGRCRPTPTAASATTQSSARPAAAQTARMTAGGAAAWRARTACDRRQSGSVQGRCRPEGAWGAYGGRAAAPDFSPSAGCRALPGLQGCNGLSASTQACREPATEPRREGLATDSHEWGAGREASAACCDQSGDAPGSATRADKSSLHCGKRG